MNIECECELDINGKRLEVKVLGSCQRAITGEILCEIERVLTTDGVDVYGAVLQDDIAPIKRRLWTAALNQRHPLGDSVEVGA